MVYSVDGIAGCEAWNAEKWLATHLAGKWNCEYSQMVFYVRVRIAKSRLAWKGLTSK